MYHDLLESSDATPAGGADRAVWPSILDGEGRVDRKSPGRPWYSAIRRPWHELNAITQTASSWPRSTRQCRRRQDRSRASAGPSTPSPSLRAALGETCGAISGHTGPQGTAHPADHGPGGDFGGLRPVAGARPRRGTTFSATHCDYILINRADDTPEAFQADVP
ncbi:MAG: dephospho-CoA kinase [Flavonifractor plautii]